MLTTEEPPTPVGLRPPAPDPTDVQSIGEFVALLRTLKVWAGDPSFEALRRRCGVPASTLADALSPARQRLPRLAIVRALVRACNGEADLERWESAWRMLQTRRRRAEPAPPELSPAVRPRQLPPEIRYFVGRKEALDLLDGLHKSQLADRQWVPLAMVVGPAGVGKTALAVRWSRRVADAYPDGQLYLDLRGVAGPTPAFEALRFLLEALGAPVTAIPTSFTARVGLYRSVTQQSRLLVVLDDAHDAEQVRELLPAGPTCMTVVTSRTRLPGLVAREDAVPLALSPLHQAEAEQLLALLVGAERTGREPAATRELARLCHGLPLTLRVAAAHLIETPDRSLAEYVRNLRTSNLIARSEGDR